jgi:hypothetical protein
MILGIIQTYVFYKVTNEAVKIAFDYSLYNYAPNVILNGITLLTDPLWSNELRKNILNKNKNNIECIVLTDEEIDSTN